MSCAICYGEKQMIQTECNHFFCRHCIHEWIKNNKSCPLCRKDLYWNIENEFITFLKLNLNRNIPISILIETFLFYYRGIHDITLSSLENIWKFLDFKDNKEYSFQNIIEAIEKKWNSQYILYISLREIIRYHNKSFLKKMKNYHFTFFSMIKSYKNK
jgi:hypothetical protein